MKILVIWVALNRRGGGEQKNQLLCYCILMVNSPFLSSPLLQGALTSTLIQRSIQRFFPKILKLLNGEPKFKQLEICAVAEVGYMELN